MQQKIVFFGTGDYVIPVIERLIPHGLDLVITTEKNPDSPLLRFCSQKNIRSISASKSSELIIHTSLFMNYQIAILASYGAFIPNEIIDIFPNGIINIHPSLLPKYKGPSPVQYALLNGETITGVTLIKLDDQIDHGPILSQKPYNLTGNETSEDLLSILFEVGAEMVEEQIEKLENGEELSETPQDHSKESWSYKIEKKDGMIDLSSDLKTENWKLKIERMIRAYYPWPGVWFVTRIKGQELRIKLLPENRIQVEGKNTMTYYDFVNGFGLEGKNLIKKISLLDYNLTHG